MKIVKSNHVTATEKKHLKAFLKKTLIKRKIMLKIFENKREINYEPRKRNYDR